MHPYTRTHTRAYTNTFIRACMHTWSDRRTHTHAHTHIQSATHVREGTVAEEQVEVSEEKAAQRRRENEDSALVAFRLMADDHASTRDVAIDIAEGYLKVARSSPCACACLMRRTCHGPCARTAGIRFERGERLRCVLNRGI